MIYFLYYSFYRAENRSSKTTRQLCGVRRATQRFFYSGQPVVRRDVSELRDQRLAIAAQAMYLSVSDRLWITASVQCHVFPWFSETLLHAGWLTFTTTSLFQLYSTVFN